tara:strand:- start:1736 stop:1852 length:117 start_codon:yes stop_codon:yes gene_type:complete
MKTGPISFSPCGAIILQDRKRLPARFFAHFCKTACGRL